MIDYSDHTISSSAQRPLRCPHCFEEVTVWVTTTAGVMGDNPTRTDEPEFPDDEADSQ